MKRLVVKVGTAVLTDPSGSLDKELISALCSQIAALRKAGLQVALVTSGAIRAGAQQLKMKRRPQLIPEKQAAAAVGQGLLLQIYTGALGMHGITAAQVLLTRDDFSDRLRYLNARNTLQTLLRFGVVPIINENDTVAVDEIRFGDNDMLAALVATSIQADLLMLLTDVPGLCQKKPKAGVPPEVIKEVSEITPEIENIAAGGNSERGGTGGMASKIAAAKVAMQAGIGVVIVRGREECVITRVASGELLGTRFKRINGRMQGRKKWIAFAVPVKGSLQVNENAELALTANKKSLLSVGIVGVIGEFESGDLVQIVGGDGEAIARGFVNYNSEEVRRIMGKKSSEIKQALGHKEYDEVIHRDNMVVGV